MRPLMHALVGLLVAHTASPALAELQWRGSGVQQASHVESAAPAPAARQSEPAASAARAKPAAKKPTIVRYETKAPKPQPKGRQPVRQAVATMPATQPAHAAAAVRIDPNIMPACGACGCVGGCSCGATYYNEPGCAVMEPGCGIVEPSCGYVEPGCGVGGCGVPNCGCGEPACDLTYGEACGCGDIGCCGECGIGCGDGVGCGDTCGVPLMLYLPPIRELTFFGGVHAFKNPLDGINRDRGNFGFNEGVNIGGHMSWFHLPALGYQIGYRGAHSQLHGDSDMPTADGHTQQFFTAGLFHRKAVGLQYGVVYDLLQDERQANADFGQVRGLISVTNPRGHEIGFQFATSTNENTINGTVYHSTDQYLLFYRQHGCEGGEFRLFGGFDDDSKGIVGADAVIPMTDRWSLITAFTYVIPEEDAAGAGAREEAWNLGTNLVWHYGKRARRSFKSQFRPMFNVADNGSLIIDNRP